MGFTPRWLCHCFSQLVIRVGNPGDSSWSDSSALSDDFGDRSIFRNSSIVDAHCLPPICPLKDCIITFLLAHQRISLLPLQFQSTCRDFFPDAYFCNIHLQAPRRHLMFPSCCMAPMWVHSPSGSLCHSLKASYAPISPTTWVHQVFAMGSNAGVMRSKVLSKDSLAAELREPLCLLLPVPWDKALQPHETSSGGVFNLKVGLARRICLTSLRKSLKSPTSGS